MSKQLLKDEDSEERRQSRVERKHPRHPITMENTREETISRMRSFPERAAKFRELIRALREADSR